MMISSAMTFKGPKTVKKVLIISDLHIPFHLQAGIDNVTRLIRDMQPDHFVVNGDYLDGTSLSRWPKDFVHPSLQEELDATLPIFEGFRMACCSMKFHVTDGNHEVRLQNTIKNEAPGLTGLKGLTYPELLDFDRLNITYSQYKEIHDIGDLSVTHGDRASKHSGLSVKGTLIDGGYKNIVIGHCHRMGTYYHTGHLGTRRGWEIGGLFDIEQATYIKGPNWQNGFFVAYMTDDLELISGHLVEVNSTDGSFIFEGRTYSA